MSLLLATRQGLYRADEGSLTPLQENADFLALARSPSQPELLYAATTEGRVFRSHNGAQSWEEMGQIAGFEELSSLAVDPQNPDWLLAGMEPSALFRSEDGGQTWMEDTAIMGMSEANKWSVPWSDAKGHVRTISIDPNEPTRIYLAIEVGGIVRSLDGGRSWENLHVGGGLHDDVHSVAVHPTESSVIFAATRHGFGRSDDSGETWTRTDSFEGQGYSRPLATNPNRPDQVFTAAATTGPGGFSRPDVGSECGVYRSNDGARTWTHLTNGLPARSRPYVDAIGVSPAQPAYVALSDTEGHVYESRDGGDSWQTLLKAPPVRRLLALDQPI